MKELRGEVIGSDAGQSVVRFDQPCKSPCGLCGGPKTILIDEVFSDAATIRLQDGTSGRILWNSLLKPLVGFMAGVSLAAWLAMGDLFALMLGATGLLAGVTWCRRLPSDAVLIRGDDQ